MVKAKDPLVANEPAIASLELATIARGVVVVDQMAKRAETAFVATRTISPGRYLILLSGTVAEIEEAMDAGIETAAEDRVDSVIIRDPAAGLRAALACTLKTKLGESLAIIETSTISATLLGVDRTLKDAEVDLLELRLGTGLSGKGVFTITGDLHMVEAAIGVVHDTLEDSRIIRVEKIARPHPDLPNHLLGAEGFTVRGRKP